MAKRPKDEPVQKTQPRGKDAEGKPAKPVTIPVPTRGEVERDLDKIMGKPSERRDDRRKSTKQVRADARGVLPAREDQQKD